MVQSHFAKSGFAEARFAETISLNPKKVHSTSKCSCFVEKIVYSVSSITFLVRTLSYCNSESSQYS